MPITINGTSLTTPPTEHGWIPKTELGVNGSGQAFYASVREYELRWQLMSVSDYNQLVSFVNTIGTTGTAAVGLPQYGAATYTFFVYSGCVLDELQPGTFFEQHVTDTVLLIRNIRT